MPWAVKIWQWRINILEYQQGSPMMDTSMLASTRYWKNKQYMCRHVTCVCQLPSGHRIYSKGNERTVTLTGIDFWLPITISATSSRGFSRMILCIHSRPFQLRTDHNALHAPRTGSCTSDRQGRLHSHGSCSWVWYDVGAKGLCIGHMVYAARIWYQWM